MDKMFRKNTGSMSASASDACFSAAVCLMMMGAISLVSIILLVGVLLLGVSVILPVIENPARESSMAA